MDILENICNGLTKAGIAVTIKPSTDGLLSNLIHFDNTRNLGRLIVQGRLIDEIVLTGIMESRTKSGPGGSRHVSVLCGVNIDYILGGNIKGKKNLLETTLKVKRKGLFNPKVIEIEWEGDALAQKLNSDSAINELLWQTFGKLLARDIEIKVDEDAGKIKIHVRDDRQAFKGDIPPFQMYENIANHIYAVAGITKTAQPLSSPKDIVGSTPPVGALPAELPSPASEMKYCFKCGSGIPLSAAFCTRCGTKQD